MIQSHSDANERKSLNEVEARICSSSIVTGVFGLGAKTLPVEEKPIFHGVRALGGALYLEVDYLDEYINWIDCAADLTL
jgi:hypothetical protein